jgi:hypothetical protein
MKIKSKVIYLIKILIYRLILRFVPEVFECHHVINPEIYNQISVEQYKRILDIIHEADEVYYSRQQ